LKQMTHFTVGPVEVLRVGLLQSLHEWVFRTIPAGCFARFRPPISEHSGPPV